MDSSDARYHISPFFAVLLLGYLSCHTPYSGNGGSQYCADVAKCFKVRNCPERCY